MSQPTGTTRRADARSPSQLSVNEAARVARFIDHVLVGGRAALGRPYHYRPARWNVPVWLAGRGVLDRYAIAKHLSGSWLVSPRWPEQVDAFEFDLDAKDDAARAHLWERLDAVGRAFLPSGSRAWERPGILWRTSAGGGLRYRLHLDRRHDAGELREQILEALARHGLAAKPGSIEVWPEGNKALRAPLGAGFRFMHDEEHEELTDAPACPNLGVKPCADDCPTCDAWFREEGAPLGHERVVTESRWDACAECGEPASRACACPAGTFEAKRWRVAFRRRTDALLSSWETKAAVRFPLSALLGSSPVVSLPSPDPEVGAPLTRRSRECAAAQAAAEAGSAAVRVPLSRRTRGEDLAARAREVIARGLGEGARNEEAGIVRWYLVAWEGKSAAEALDWYAAWLEQAAHGSRELSDPGRRGQLIAAMVRSARGDFAKLEKGPPSRREHPLLPPCSSRERGPNSERRWKRAKLASLTDADRRVVEGAPEAWLVEALGALVARIREVQALHPDVATLAIPKVAFECFATKNMRRGPWDAADAKPRTSASILLDEAQRLGILGDTVGTYSRARRRAQAFELGPAMVGTVAPDRIAATMDDAQDSLADAQVALASDALAREVG